MWLPFQLGQVTEHSCWKRFSKYQTQKKKRKIPHFPHVSDATFQVETLLLMDFQEHFNCGAGWLAWCWTYLATRCISAKEALYWLVIWQGALCAMIGLWAGIMLSLPSAASQQRKWLRPSSRRRISILRYLGCSFRYWYINGWLLIANIKHNILLFQDLLPPQNRSSFSGPPCHLHHLHNPLHLCQHVVHLIH